MFLLTLLFCVSLVVGECPKKSGSEKTTECPFGHGKPFGEHVEHMKKLNEINEVPSPEEFYAKYLRKNEPIVIRGLGKDWPAVKKWSNMSYISEHNDHGRYIHTVNWHGLYGYDYKHNQGLNIPMSEFIERMERGENVYLDSTLPWGLWKDVKWPRFLACDWWIKQLKQIAIFFNSGKSNTDIHIDTTETFFVQISGERRWILSPPKDTNNLYAGANYHEYHTGSSRVDVRKVDLKRDANLTKADLYVTYLKPGDMIYVPETWYHTVKTKDQPNIALAVFINVMWCTKWFDRTGDDESDEAHLKKCLWLRDQLPKEIKCKSPAEEDMIPLNELKKKYPENKGLDVCTKKCNLQACYTALRNHLIPVNGGDKKRHTFPLVGLSLAGVKQDVLESEEAFKIVNNSYDECNRMIVVTPEDNSLITLGNIFKRLDAKKQRVYRVVLDISFEYAINEEEKGRNLKTIITESIFTLSKKRIDLLLLRAPFCDPPAIINTTEGCDRDLWKQRKQDWMSIWEQAEELWKKGTILALGIKDMTLKELKHLHKEISPNSISVISARVDPFFRNSALREYAEKYKMQVLAHGILGGHYVRHGMTHPYYTSHATLYGAFSISSTVYTGAIDWAFKRNMMVAPRVKSFWEARMLLKVFTLQQAVDHKKNPEALDPIVQDDPMNERPLRTPELDETIEDEHEKMQRFSSDEEEEKDYSYFPAHVLNKLQDDLRRAGKERLSDQVMEDEEKEKSKKDTKKTSTKDEL